MKDRLLLSATAKRLRENGDYDNAMSRITVMISAHSGLRDVPQRLAKKQMNLYSIRAYVEVLSDWLDEDHIMWPVFVIFYDAVSDAQGEVTKESLDSFYTLPPHEQIALLSSVMLAVRRHDAEVPFGKTCMWRRFQLEAADTLKTPPTDPDARKMMELLLQKDKRITIVFIGSIMSIARVHMPDAMDCVRHFLPGLDLDSECPADEALYNAFNSLPDVEKVAGMHFCETYWSKTAQATFEEAVEQSKE